MVQRSSFSTIRLEHSKAHLKLLHRGETTWLVSCNIEPCRLTCGCCQQGPGCYAPVASPDLSRQPAGTACSHVCGSPGVPSLACWQAVAEGLGQGPSLWAVQALAFPELLLDHCSWLADMRALFIIEHRPVLVLQAVAEGLGEGPSLWAVEALAAPLVERLKVHFSPGRPTDRMDKPEWLLNTILQVRRMLCMNLA